MYWVTRNGCVPSPQVSWEPDRDPEDGTRVRRESYNRCRNGAEAEKVNMIFDMQMDGTRKP